jgi:hypothetical protein
VIRFFALCLLLVASVSCARYGVHNDGARQYPPSELSLNSSRAELTGQLQRYLKKRGFSPNIDHMRMGSSTDFELDWVRDSSLEYFYILSGTRLPHLSHWKAVWRLTDLGPRRTLVHVEIMELLYMGPRDEAGAIPSLNGQWVSAPDSHLRGWVELRRFFTETFPGQALPRDLALIEVPSLASPPLAMQDYRPLRLHRSSRPSSF